MQFEDDNILVLDIPQGRSSFLRKIEYYPDKSILVVYFRKYYKEYEAHQDVTPDDFDEFNRQPSIGRYYLNHIKQHFKTINLNNMADKPKTKNEASDQKRFIKMSINVQEIEKAWLIAGEKGTYLSMTLQMLPDGKVDRYGNLGMITQDVPKSVYEKEKHLKKEERTQGAILGNAAEFDFERSNNEGAPGQDGKLVGDEPIDDLPF